MTAPSNQPSHNDKAEYGTLDYFQQELNSETPWRRLDAARSLADKAAENFALQLEKDYQTTLGVDANDSEYDEIMIAEAQAECEALRAKILKDLQSTETNDAHQAKGYTGGYLSPVIGLFKIATLNNTDPFLDIATLEGDLSFESMAKSNLDGPYDKYGFDIDNAIDREMALRAIMSESDTTLYQSRVRT